MEEINKLADKVKTSLNLRYDNESVKFIEGFIERTKIQIPKEEWDGLINSCAAFLGRCIIENYGGQWGKRPNGDIVIVFSGGTDANPYAKTKKQFENGLEDSVFSMYSAIPVVFKDYIPIKKKKWWKKFKF
jgi:hypothetical protein